MKQKKNIFSNIFVYIMIFTVFASLSATAVFSAQPAVDLGTAGDFVILAKTGISATGTTDITGNIGVSPAAASFITGFGLIADPSNEFATSAIVTGKAYAADYTPPTPTVMTTAISDMETAYTDAAGRTLPNYTELGAGNIDGMTLTSGLYKWGTSVLVPTGVTISGSSSDIWIFQIAGDFDLSNGAIVTLAGGAQAKNIFWQVAGQTTLGTTSQMKGIILSQTAIIFNTGATLNGRALAQTAVTLDASTVSISAGTSSSSSGSSSSGSSGSGSGSNSGSGIVVTTPTQPVVTTPTTPAPTTQPTQTTTTTTTTTTNVPKTAVEGQTVDIVPSAGIQVNTNTANSGNSKDVIVKEILVNGVSAKTDLKVMSNTDAMGKAAFTTTLDNGSVVSIKIMPDVASKNALAALGMSTCSSENSCTIQLKSVGSGKNEKVQYEMSVRKSVKLFGIFTKKMTTTATVDVQTGATSVRKPFWAFMATE